MQGKKDYQEKLFIRFQLSDYVPADNFYRQLKNILDLNFLYQSTSDYYGKEGQKSIDPVVFMKFMLVGYIENLHSDRRIVATSRMRMDILYFLGYDLDEELPWHSTLSRTRKLYGEEQFIAIFKKVLKLCIDEGLISGKRQAVDSALIPANASKNSMIEKQIMEDAHTYSKELDANSEAENSSAIKPIAPKSPKKRLRDGSAPYTNQTHFSPSDPDARLTIKHGKAFNLYYRSQVSVDTSSYFITHIQAFHGDKADCVCFSEVLKQTAENMQENNLQVTEVLADTGYSSAEVLQTLIDNKIEGYIPNANGYKASREGFTYDPTNDRYICPQGAYLTLRSIRERQKRIAIFNKIYKSNVSDCIACPLSKTCTTSKNIKEISDSIHKPLYDEMHYKMQTDKAKKMRKLRQSTVEPVLGTLINYTGLKKVHTKGLKQANKCMIMAAVVYNLKKFIRTKSTRIKNKLTNPDNGLRTPSDGLCTGLNNLIISHLNIFIMITTFKRKFSCN